MKKARVHRYILPATFLLICAAGAFAQRNPAVLGFDSFAGVRVGMTVAEGSKALGVRLVTTETDAECRYYSAKTGFKDIGFMTTKGIIVRFDIQERGYATTRGARVGDTEARIKQLYKGEYKISKHAYVDGHYIEVRMRGRKYSIIFETDGKRVTYIRAGRAPEVGYIEGCS